MIVGYKKQCQSVCVGVRTCVDAVVGRCARSRQSLSDSQRGNPESTSHQCALSVDILTTRVCSSKQRSSALTYKLIYRRFCLCLFTRCLYCSFGKSNKLFITQFIKQCCCNTLATGTFTKLRHKVNNCCCKHNPNLISFLPHIPFSRTWHCGCFGFNYSSQVVYLRYKFTPNSLSNVVTRCWQLTLLSIIVNFLTLQSRGTIMYQCFKY